MDEDDLSSFPYFRKDGVPYDILIPSGYESVDALFFRRRSRDHGKVPDSIESEIQASRNRGRRKRQDIQIGPEPVHLFLIGNSEFMLLVNHHQSEILETDILSEESVRSYGAIQLPIAELSHDCLFLGRRCESGQQPDSHSESFESLQQ